MYRSIGLFTAFLALASPSAQAAIANASVNDELIIDFGQGNPTEQLSAFDTGFSLANLNPTTQVLNVVFEGATRRTLPASDTFNVQIVSAVSFNVVGFPVRVDKLGFRAEGLLITAGGVENDPRVTFNASASLIQRRPDGGRTIIGQTDGLPFELNGPGVEDFDEPNLFDEQVEGTLLANDPTIVYELETRIFLNYDNARRDTDPIAVSTLEFMDEGLFASVLEVTAIPSPSTGAVFALGALATARRRR